MKGKYTFVTVLLGLLTCAAVLICSLGKEVKKDRMLVVTSFYPVYIATLNVADGADGVQVKCLSQPTTGCVHNKQLTTTDMVLLEQADLFVVNGAGMESYLDDVRELYPNLPIVETDAGAEILSSEGHAHVHESEDGHEQETHEQEGHEQEDHEQEESVEHNHTENAHIWMDMDNYILQVESIGRAFEKLDKTNQTRYKENVEEYVKKIEKLQENGEKLKDFRAYATISTHEAFSYLAHNFDWEITETINMDENSSLNAAQVGEVIDMATELGQSYVFTEKTYGTKLSSILQKEAKCKIVELDTLTSGEYHKDAYLDGMKKNIDILKEVADYE